MLREDDEVGSLSGWVGEFFIGEGGVEFFVEDWFSWI